MCVCVCVCVCSCTGLETGSVCAHAINRNYWNVQDWTGSVYEHVCVCVCVLEGRYRSWLEEKKREEEGIQAATHASTNYVDVGYPPANPAA